MISIAFPDMVNNASTKLLYDHDATLSNLKLILGTTTRNCLFGDPYYGTGLMKMMFEQNSVLLEDIVKDEIYSAIQLYVPQLKLTRDDITLDTDGTKLTATIKAVNRIDYKPDLYSIDLTTFDEV